MRKILLILMLLTVFLAAGRLASAESLPAGALALVELDRGEQVYTFVPPSGSQYDVCLFPAGETEAEVHTALYRGDALEAEADGGMTAISLRMARGAEYTLKLTGTGQVRLEVARHTLSRCFELPMALDADGDSYSKAVARAGDVHWYAITAEVSRPVALAGLPSEPGLKLEARLFSESGSLLAEATQTDGGAFLMDFMPRAGRAYRVRVSAGEGQTGMYSLLTSQGEGGLPEALQLSESAIRIEGRDARRLTATVSPAGATDAVFWESSDPSVARVNQNGTVTGVNPGSAVITAYAAGAVRARCRVEVRRVAVEGIRLDSAEIDLNAGDELPLRWEVFPENASEPGVTFQTDPAEGIVSVSKKGILRALEEGRAGLTITTVDGGFTIEADITVHPAPKRCRALLLGEQNYASTVATPRLGSANSVAGMRSALKQVTCGGQPIDVVTALDVSRDGAIRAIREAFGGMTAQDEALFYITCHGYYAHGMTFFQMYDGSVLTARELRLALDIAPCRVTLLADCCGSGGVIGRATDTGDILHGIESVFGGAAGPSLFGGSGFRVLCSASIDQDSYRISFEGGERESGMATVFARAFCEGCGWSIEDAARCPMRADVDGDGAVTLDELYRYTARRVDQYLRMNDDGNYIQTVRVSPQGDTGAMFEAYME